MPSLFAGCDGGGTSCIVRVAVTDENNQLVAESKAQTGPANVRSDPISAEANIREALNRGLHDLPESVLQSQIETSRIVLALAGAGDLQLRTLWAARLSDLPFKEIKIVPDPAILFAAADVGVQPAVATIIGTGSIAWFRTYSKDSEATIIRAGGEGPIKGDHGSAFWIGREWARSQGRPQASSSLGIVEQLAEEAKTVFAKAEQGDPIAAGIIEQASDHIAALLLQACGTIDTNQDSPLSWIASGGVAMHQQDWLTRIQLRCRAQGLFLTSPEVVKQPVIGALRMAMNQSGE